MAQLTDLNDVIASLARLVEDPSLLQRSESEIDELFYGMLDDAVQLESDVGTAVPWASSSLSIANFSPANDLDVDQGHSRRLDVSGPLNDEVGKGWLGRMTLLNCLASEEELLIRMRESAKQLHSSITSDSEVVQFGSVILQASERDFVRYLTFDAYNRALVGRNQNKPGTKSPRHLAAYERHALFKLPGINLKFCRECLQQDLDEKGFSYWHRSHQISGSLWCERHEISLSIATDQKSINRSPNKVSSYEERRIDQLSVTQKKILKRYTHIANAVLRIAPQINGAAASEIFAKKAKALDLRTGQVGKRKTVSTYLQELLPSWWLSENFPRVKWQVDKRIPAIDSACTPQNTQRYTTNTFCLLAAIFYEDIEEAIAELMNPQRSDQRKKGAAFWSRKEVFSLYVECEGNASRVAERLEMNQATVHAGLRNQGLPAFGNYPEIRGALTRFLAGESLMAVCSSEGEVTALEAVVRTACTPCKQALDAMNKDGDDVVVGKQRTAKSS